MEFRTEIKIDKAPFAIHVWQQSMFIGSCFAENMGKIFEEHRLRCLVNPFGVLYNPLSVADALTSIIEKRGIGPADLFHDGLLWHSPSHHGRFSGSKQDDVLRELNTAVDEANLFLKSSHTIFITFGTSWVYRHLESGKVVANCHKQPAHRFERYRLSVDEIQHRVGHLLEQLKKFAPQINVVFTISPVRHWKDTAHGNQLSKSVLLLAVEQLVQQFPFAHYFPAYELVMDDLRDYRFYCDDMLHPNSMAVAYIWEKLKAYCFDKKTEQYVFQIRTVVDGLNHRPLHPDSPAYLTFLQKLNAQIEQMGQLYPGADLAADKLLVTNLLAGIK